MFTAEYQLQIKFDFTTQQAGYNQANYISERSSIPTSNISPKLQEATTNFATASAADRDGFAQLTQTNSELQQNLQFMQEQNNSLQQHLLYLSLNNNKQNSI